GVSQGDELGEGLDLLGVLLTVAGPVLAEGLVCHRVLGALLVGDQGVGAVQGQAPVVADDAAAAIGIGQTGDDVAGAGGADPDRKSTRLHSSHVSSSYAAFCL